MRFLGSVGSWGTAGCVMGKRASAGQAKAKTVKGQTSKPDVPPEEESVNKPSAWQDVKDAIEVLRNRGEWLEAGSDPRCLPGLSAIPSHGKDIPPETELPGSMLCGVCVWVCKSLMNRWLLKMCDRGLCTAVRCLVTLTGRALDRVDSQCQGLISPAREISSTRTRTQMSFP